MGFRLSLDVGLGATINQGEGYSAEAMALFARFTTPPTVARKTLINNMIVALKAAGVWAKLDCLWLEAAADSQAARQNWMRDAFNLTAINSPNFTVDRGYAGDGSTSYLLTAFTPSTAGGKLTQNAASAGDWMIAPAGDNSMDFGCNGSAVNYILMQRGAATLTGRIDDATTATGLAASIPTNNFIAAARTSSTNATLYGDSGAAISRTDSPSGLPTTELYLLGRNNNGAFANGTTARQAMMFVGSDLTGANITAIRTTTLTYLQAIGASL